MAKNKAPRKKYKPGKRVVFNPQLVNGYTAFLPVKQALDILLKNEEIDVNEEGEYIYHQADGKIRVMAHEVRVYIKFLELLSMRNKVEYNTKPFEKLLEQLQAKQGFDQEVVLESLKLLEYTQRVACVVTQATSRSVIKSIKIAAELDRIEDEAQAAQA